MTQPANKWLTAGVAAAFNLLAAAPGYAHDSAYDNVLAFKLVHIFDNEHDERNQDYKPDDPREHLSFYYQPGQKIPAGVQGELDWFFRDLRKSEPAHMDPHLLDLLFDLKIRIERRHPDMAVLYEVLSAHRSKATNEMLRRAGGAQAKYSLHIQDMAIDIHVPGLDTKELRDIAAGLGKGGVGYYAPRAGDFVHVDTGRVRCWWDNGPAPEKPVKKKHNFTQMER